MASLGHATTRTLKNCVAFADDRQPSAALARPQGTRALDDTIVLGPENRPPPDSQGQGWPRHNSSRFLALACRRRLRRGYVHGATDDFVTNLVHDVVRVYDLHATLLHALGLDHIKLTYPHKARADSLTDVSVKTPGDASVVELTEQNGGMVHRFVRSSLVYGLYSRPKREGAMKIAF